MYMGVVLKVHARVLNCQDRQGSNMRPRDQFFFSEFAKVFLWVKDLANNFNLIPRRKIDMGFAKDLGKYFLFAKNVGLQ